MLPGLKSIGDIKGKSVLLRVDFNVPLREGAVPLGAEWRLKAVLPTLDYLARRGAKIIILAHLGRPKGKDLHYSLYPVFLKLLEIWPKGKLFFGGDVLAKSTEKQIGILKDGQAVLLENLRFYSEEEENDAAFARSLSSLGDFFVNDAFAACHRAHASIVGLPKFLKSFAGLLLEKEVTVLSAVRSLPRRPSVWVMGGAKAETKLQVVKEFAGRSEGMLLGGVLANTLLYAKGVAVGKSIIAPEIVPEVKKLDMTLTSLHLPVDVLISKSLTLPVDMTVRPVGRIGPEEFIIDIGPDTIDLFCRVIKTARMIVWNGSLGLTEIPAFKRGSLEVARAIAQSPGEKIIGGGDLVSFLTEENLIDRMTYVSTGGGAMLEFLAGEELPGIAALVHSNKYQISPLRQGFEGQASSK